MIATKTDGAFITHYSDNGKHYISLADNNVWSPDAYPAYWKVV